VQRDPERVRRRGEELGCDALGDVGDGAVLGDDIPVAVDDDGRVGLVRRQEALERRPDRGHLVLVE
jgi:hypothetical protein